MFDHHARTCEKGRILLQLTLVALRSDSRKLAARTGTDSAHFPRTPFLHHDPPAPLMERVCFPCRDLLKATASNLMPLFSTDSIALCYSDVTAAKKWWMQSFGCKDAKVPADWDCSLPSD